RPMAELMEQRGIIFIRGIELSTQRHGYIIVFGAVICPVSRLMTDVGAGCHDKVFRSLQRIPLKLLYIGLYQRCDAVDLTCIEDPSGTDDCPVQSNPDLYRLALLVQYRPALFITLGYKFIGLDKLDQCCLFA